MKQELKKQLTLDEDKRKFVYKDSKGYYTIAIGRLVDDRFPGSGLREDEIEYLLNNDIDDRIEQLTRKLPWFQDLDDVRKGVLINMAFQLGVEGLLGFSRTLEQVRLGNYWRAAMYMLASKWAIYDTPKRAKRMSKQMETGVWQYADGSK
jgi:lysozyme